MISNKVLLIFIIVIFIKSCIGLNNEGITFVINNNIFIFKLKYDKYVYSVYLRRSEAKSAISKRSDFR
jgi:hypothetical protein